MTNSETGRYISLKEHIQQSIKNILFTRIGTRLQREDYGSLLPELIDMPLSPAVVMMCHVATASALGKWEPRIDVRAVSVDVADAAAGCLKISVSAAVKSSGTVEEFTILSR